MITFIARLRVNPGREEAAAARVQAMVAAVQDQEPGALIYIGHYSEAEDREMVFFEVYADEAAAEAHEKTPHFAELLADFGDVFDAEFGVKIEYLDRVAGVVRA